MEELGRIGMVREGEAIYFDFEKLNVYQRALDFLDCVFDMCKQISPLYKNSVIDQLQRTAVSICTNIAEGCGKLSRREKIRYYSYALDSAKECIPCLTIAYRQKQVSQEENARAREACTIICRMLGKLIKSVEDAELKKG
ncbi:MAG: four helix bundle protein [Candidatus Aureabacteria bacterium]|nr:four helix bundle protein [Candidatus Auribacterota bacterium]